MLSQLLGNQKSLYYFTHAKTEGDTKRHYCQIQKLTMVLLLCHFLLFF